MGRLLRFRQKLNNAFLLSALGLATVSMNGCDAFYWNEESTLLKVQSKSEIVVLTTKSPLIYSQPRRGEAFGIDHDLLQNFGRHYNLKFKFVVLPDEDAVLKALYSGQGDIAAARLRTPSKNMGFLTGPAYEETHLSLFCHRNEQIENIKDLNGKKIILLNKDNYLGLAQRLKQLSPSVKIEVQDSMLTQNLLAKVHQKQSHCVIAENLSGEFFKRYYPNVEKITSLSEAYSLSWLLTPNNPELLRLMQSWFQKASREDEITKVHDRYRGYLSQLNRRDVAKFLKMIRTTLPTFHKDFRKAAREHGLPWQLVASVAYQESHWNPDARSFTGVRGLMQLTTDTALYLGIDDRTDPTQSIWGGSKYLRFLLDKVPSHIHPKDRLALALAAYNVGLSHLKDAQNLALKLGKNPHSWAQLREVLPLLADPGYIQELKYGPARGHETVDFVERVKSFYNIMNVAG